MCLTVKRCYQLRCCCAQAVWRQLGAPSCRCSRCGSTRCLCLTWHGWLVLQMPLLLLTMTLASLNLRLQLLNQPLHFRQTPCCCPGAKFLSAHSTATTAAAAAKSGTEDEGAGLKGEAQRCPGHGDLRLLRRCWRWGEGWAGSWYCLGRMGGGCQGSPRAAWILCCGRRCRP